MCQVLLKGLEIQQWNKAYKYLCQKFMFWLRGHKQ